MRAEYTFSKQSGRRSFPAKARHEFQSSLITRCLTRFARRPENAGVGYETLINDALKQFLSESGRPITETALCQILKAVLPPRQKRLTTRSAGSAQTPAVL